MAKINVYCGLSVNDVAVKFGHPLVATSSAENLLATTKEGMTNKITCNDPEFISMMRYAAPSFGVDTEFFLDGVSVGNNIEPIFDSFNECFKLIDKYDNYEQEEYDIHPHVGYTI